MLSENRKYSFIGKLNLKRSQVLNERCEPKDDKVNWLFLNTGKQQFSFIYKIEEPVKAKYNMPFKAQMAFTMIEIAKNILELEHDYEILRGQELIGTVNLIESLD